MNRVAGKVALITGGGRGAGGAHARLLTAEGASAVLADVLDADGEALAVELGHAARFVHLDMTQESDWANALRLTLAEFGHLDLLVNNAGIANGSPIGDFPRVLRQKTVEINLTGSFLGMKTVSSVLASQGHSSIINVSSVEGRRGSSRYWRPSAAGRFRVPTCRSSCSLPPVPTSTTDRGSRSRSCRGN